MVTLARMLWLVLVRRVGTQAFYDAFADRYDRLVAGQPGAADAVAFLREHLTTLGLRAGRTLEVGFGTGLYTRHLHGLSAEIHGVDFSVGQVRQARRNGVAVVPVLGDARALPYRDAAFDLVASFDMLAHLPGSEASYFAEAWRVLKPGGVIVLDPLPARGPADGWPNRLRRRVRALAYRAVVRLSNIEAWGAVPAPEELAEGLRAVGFDATTETREAWASGALLRYVVGRKPAA